MEGILLKWTNYVTGWQPRWFILREDGTLAYFNSRDDTRNGCRGSVNLGLCEIIVHQNDPKRLDIVIPGEQHYSLKATTASDRSTWLKILGSSKILCKGRSRDSGLNDVVKSHRSEVRLYMDLILQQASDAQHALDRESDKDAALNSLNMLVTTAQVLARSVDEFLSLSSFNGQSEAHIVTSPLSTPAPARTPDTNSAPAPIGEAIGVSSPVNYFNSALGLTLHQPKSPTDSDKISIDIETPTTNESNKHSSDAEDSGAHSSPESNVGSLDNRPTSDTPVIPNKSDKSLTKILNTDNSEDVPKRYKFKTTFKELEGHTFNDVEIQQPSGDMMVRPFLEAARTILTLLDRLKTSVLSPVRSDVGGNIDKIENALRKYDGTKVNAATCTMQELIQVEIDAKKATSDPSAFVGLVWLLRGLEFISLFFKHLAEPSSTDARQCATEAYQKTLKAYHGIMARTVFSLALQALPAKPSQFLLSIGGGSDADLTNCRSDITHYIVGLRNVIDPLSAYIAKTGLIKKI